VSAAEQLTLADYAHDLEEERAKVKRANSDRRKRRAWVVFATHPERVGEEDYKLVFACEAKTQAEAEAKVRDQVEDDRRVIAYLASGKYGAMLAEARWLS
jgi:hypothetical protein